MTSMLICWIYLYGAFHYHQGVWGLETCWGSLGTVTERVAEEVIVLASGQVAGTFHYLGLPGFAPVFRPSLFN